MAKEYYHVTYKTYHNERIKPVVFRGRETHPLYVQVTWDRRTIIFKSYYFELFRRKKYDSEGASLTQIDEMEGQVIDYIVNTRSNTFYLERLPDQYKLYNADVLDKLERPFIEWLARCLQDEGLPRLAAMLMNGMEEVLAIQLFDDLKGALQPDFFSRIEDKAIREAPPYYLLATYVRHRGGPFCLPCFEWVVEENQIAMEFFLDDVFWQVRTSQRDFGEVIREINRMMLPQFKR